MADLVVHNAEGDRELGAGVADALRAAGHRVESPQAAPGALPAAGSVPRLHLVLVTRHWSRGGDLGALLARLREAGEVVLLVWWDEDAPSDFLGNGGRTQETIEVFYACFLPAQDRIQALVQRLRD